LHHGSAHTFVSARRRIPTTQCLFHASRSFSISSSLCKKAGKANKAHALSDSSPPVSNPGQPTATDEAYDVSGLESQILKAIEKLTHDLSQLRGGGKLNPEVVESLKVQLGTAGQGKETVRLGDIAQVVPRGRTINVVCGEEEVRLYSSKVTSEAPTDYPPAPQTNHLRHRRLASLPHPSCARVVDPPHNTGPAPAANRRVSSRRRRVGHQGIGACRQVDTDCASGTQQAPAEV
jgi:hypothetical protein